MGENHKLQNAARLYPERNAAIGSKLLTSGSHTERGDLELNKGYSLTGHERAMGWKVIKS